LIEKQVAGRDGKSTQTILGDFSPKEGRNTGIRSAGPSTVIGIFDAATGQMTDLDLAGLNPPFKSIGPGASFFLADEGSIVSPISLMTVNANTRLGVLDLVSRRVVNSYENFVPNTAVWSPDGRMLAVRSRRSVKADFQAYVIDMITGQIKDLGFKHMIPVAWLESQTVVWMNRWSGQDPKVVGPFKLMVTDMKTGESKVVPMHIKGQ
jgi:hypothetical protein